MEALVIIGGLTVAWFVIGFLLSVKRSAEYIGLVELAMEKIKSDDYQSSVGYKSRVDHINNVGLKEALQVNLTELRHGAVRTLKMKPKHFDVNGAIVKAEHQLNETYAFVHGKGDEYQSSPGLSKEVEDYMRLTWL